jgi:S1-C subfamily serine protease
VARGYLGVSLQSVPIREGEHHRRGAMVVTIDPAGPAHAGGLKQGDVIVAMDGEPVTGVRSVYQRLGPDSVGRRAAFDLLRAGAPTKLEVTVAARPHG